MRQKEWGKFGRDVMRYARELKEKGIVSDKRQIIIVVGNHDNQMDKDKGSLREKFILEMNKRGFEIVDGEINEMMKTIHKKMTRSAGKLIIDKLTDTLGDRKEWFVHEKVCLVVI